MAPKRTKPIQCEPTELRNWPIFFCEREIKKIRERANRNRREPYQEVMTMLESLEHLEADVTPEIQGKADAIKNLSRPTPDETA